MIQMSNARVRFISLSVRRVQHGLHHFRGEPYIGRQPRVQGGRASLGERRLGASLVGARCRAGTQADSER